MKISRRVLWPLFAVLTLAACEDGTPKVDHEATFVDPSPNGLDPCFDGAQNGEETDVDCGGRLCAACTFVGAVCVRDLDCESTRCVNGACAAAASCTDGIKDGTESDIDCGGHCAACGDGAACLADLDCTSGVCADGQCAAPSCSDGVRNGVETDVDCGGGSCAPCGTSQHCWTAPDCLSDVCIRGLCRAATCSDGVRNQDETAPDCGGATCGSCAAGLTCSTAADCSSSVCLDGTCQAPTCSDAVRNGDETALDCGGSTCPSCGDGNTCLAATDCTSSVCTNGVCLPASCGDQVQNDQETDLDCGGPVCAPCGTGQTCGTSTDCSSSVCTNGSCQAPTCTDGVRNAAETSTDCGGGTCPACAIGLSCSLNSDCASGNCEAGSCGPVIIISVVVTPGSTSVPLGRSQGFIATATYSDGTTADVTATSNWSGSDLTLVSISATGVLQTLALGTTNVIATFGGATSNPAAVTVVGPALDRIDLSPTGVQLPSGLVQPYQATGTFSDGSTADLTSTVTWSSSAPSVASVSSTGLATGLSAGTTDVTATRDGIVGTAALVITGVSVTSLAVNPASVTLPVGVNALFVATAVLSDGTVRDVSSLASWTTGSASVATVSASSPTWGLVTTVGAGTTGITATLAGNSGTASLAVINATLQEIQIFPPDESLPRGFELQYGAVGRYSDGYAYDLTLTATWASSDPSIAAVSNTFPGQGVVTTIALGSTQLSASLGAISGSTSLTVNDATLTSLSVTPALATLPIGAPLQYRATGVFSDGLARDVTALVNWQTTNAAVATISNAPATRGLLLSVGTGSTIISASLGGQVGEARLNVTSASFEQLIIDPGAARTGLQGVVNFRATAIYTDGTAIDVTELGAWTSSDTSVATVRNDTGFRGLALGLMPGTATISVRWLTHGASAGLTVTTATLQDLYISPAVVTTGLDIDVQFNASGVWTDGTNADLTRVVTWTSSLNQVAVISNAAGSKGLASTLSPGTTVISVGWAGLTDETTLTVTNARLSSITVTPATATIGLGIQLRYQAMAIFDDGTRFDITNSAAWSSSNGAVATVSGASGSVGLATGLAAGTAIITAQMRTVSGSARLTVSGAALVSLTVSPANATLPVGYWAQFNAVAVYADGLTFDVTAQATWTTGSPLVASVGNGSFSGGRVIGLSTGTTSVIARFGGLTGTAQAAVYYLRLIDVTVTPSQPSTLVGVPIQLTAIGTFTDGVNTFDLDITQQVGWKVAPKKNGTVSNTDGSRGWVTMYNESSFANLLAQAWEPYSATTKTGNTKVYAP